MNISIERPDIHSTISADKMDLLVAKLERMIEMAQGYRQNWDNVHQRNWRMYRCIPSVAVQEWPWRNAANYFIPVAAVTADIFKSLVYKAMFDQPPEIAGEGVEDEEVARKLNRYLFNHVWKKQISLPHLSDGWNLDTVIDGTSAVKTWYDNSQIAIREDVPEIKYKTEKERVVIDGQEVEVPVQTGEMDINVTEEIKVFRAAQPRAETVDLSFLYVAPGSRAGLQYPDCEWYYEVMYKTKDELYQLKRDGWENVDDDLFMTMEERDLTEREQLNREQSGVSDTSLDTATVYCFHMRLPLAGEYIDSESREVTTQRFMEEGGIAEEVMIYYFPETQKVALVAPLTRERIDNERPHTPNYYDRIDKHFYGQGMMDKMRHLQKLMNTSFNQMVDYGSLRNLPFFFFSPAQTGIMPDMSTVQPGEGIPVNDPRGIVMPRFQGNDAHFQSLMANAQQWVERVGHVNDLNAGRNASGPNRTARGMFQLLEQSNNLTAYRIALWAEQYKAVFRQVFNLIRRHSPGQQEYSYLNEETGRLTRESVPLDLFVGDFDFTFHLNPNKVLKQQSVQNMFQLLMGIPQFAQQNPAGLRELAREVATSFDLADKFDKLWPQEQLQMQTPMPMQGQPGQPQSPEGGLGPPQMQGPGPNGSGFENGGGQVQ